MVKSESTDRMAAYRKARDELSRRTGFVRMDLAVPSPEGIPMVGTWAKVIRVRRTAQPAATSLHFAALSPEPASARRLSARKAAPARLGQPQIGWAPRNRRGYRSRCSLAAPFADGDRRATGRRNRTTGRTSPATPAPFASAPPRLVEHPSRSHLRQPTPENPPEPHRKSDRH